MPTQAFGQGKAIRVWRRESAPGREIGELGVVFGVGENEVEGALIHVFVNGDIGGDPGVFGGTG